MYKKLLISLGILVASAFAFTVVTANDGGDALKTTVNDVRNVVGGVENTVENAAKDVANTSRNATGTMENGTNNETATRNNNNNNSATVGTTTNNAGYTATRTGTTDTNLMGMNATAWTWLIIGVAAIAIVALVWYYGTQLRSSNYDDRD